MKKFTTSDGRLHKYSNLPRLENSVFDIFGRDEVSYKNRIFTESIGRSKFTRPLIVSILLVGLLFFFFFLIASSVLSIFIRDSIIVSSSEGFNATNTEYTYYPKKADRLQEPNAKFFINDFIRDALEVPDCIKIYKQLMPVEDMSSANTQPEYSTQSISDTNIYKKYNSDFIDEAKGTALLDEQFGALFKKETFIVPKTKSQIIELKDFKKTVEKSMLFENKLHNFIKYSAIESFESKFSFTEFSDYFATIIYKYHTKPQQLEDIKKFMYKLIRPLYLYSKFVDHFISSQTVYPAKDDILYLLNTAKDLLKEVKIEDFPHSNSERNVYIFKEDSENVSNKTLTIDSLTIFSLIHILIQIRKVMQPGSSKMTQISDEEFSSIFQTYLNKKFPDIKTKSIICDGFNPANAPTLIDG